MTVALPSLRGRDVGDSDHVSPTDAEQPWRQLLDASRPILRALRDAARARTRLTRCSGRRRDADAAGGSTLAAELFGRLPHDALPPDEAVALGAAVQAALKAGDAAVEDMVVTDVAPFTMGIATATNMGRHGRRAVLADPRARAR